MTSVRFEKDPAQRLAFIKNRSTLEARHLRRHLKKRKRKLGLLDLGRLSKTLGVFLKATGLWRYGYAQATNIVSNRYDLYFDDLPKFFEGYRILHLSDLHLDFVAGTADKIAAQIEKHTYDICLISGDYRRAMWGGISKICDPLAILMAAQKAPDGVWATLGNHDTWQMVKPFERMGINILVNETAVIRRGQTGIWLTGVDDPHLYFSHQALNAFKKTPDHFKIALAHSPELYQAAAKNRYRLYLCGHTHGGQICLPGGIPVATNSYTGRRFSRGLWRYAGMQGFTNQGCGTVDIPIRFFTESEIALITLHGKTA